MRFLIHNIELQITRQFMNIALLFNKNTYFNSINCNTINTNNVVNCIANAMNNNKIRNHLSHSL